MPLPLIAAAIGAGSAVLGISNARKNARANRDTVKRAYKIAERNLLQTQGDIRQQVGESNVARGLGGMSFGTQAPAAVAAAPAGKGIVANLMRKGAARQAGWANESARGATGDPRTLGGAIQKDLSKEFGYERQDLWEQRRAGINGANAQGMQESVNAIAGGAQTAMSIYNAGKTFADINSIKGAYGVHPVQGSITDPTMLPGENPNDPALMSPDAPNYLPRIRR